MTRRLYIDPGTRAIGCAVFQGPRLVEAWYSVIRARDINDMIAYHAHRPTPVDEAIVEHMESQDRVPPQDLINAQAVGCSVGGLLARSVRLIKPSRWKGSIPKLMHHRRLIKVLDAHERAVLGSILERVEAGKTRGHDKEVLDAVGIGLFDLQRTNRSGSARV